MNLRRATISLALAGITIACSETGREIPTAHIDASVPEVRLLRIPSGPERQPHTYLSGRPVRGGRQGATTFDVCPIEGPVPDGCPLEFQDSDDENPFATEVGTATGLETLWTGRDVNPSSDILECSPYLVNPSFTIYVPDYGSTVTFAGHGTFNKIATLPTLAGVPGAVYQVGSGPYYSARPLGTYSALGGTIEARCLTTRFRTGTGVALIMGKNIYSNYTGQIIRNGATSGGGEDETERGWASSYSDETTGASTESAINSPSAVILNYVSHDECTIGWEVWIDGDLKCNADGTHT